MKGFKGWIEVFRAGRHKDSDGHEQTWSEKDIDLMISNYDPKQHEAPAVIGHPKMNTPSYGWVEALKREGDIMLAKFKDVVPEFAESVEKGLFKKRSISIYPDGRLKHVGFLGATPPAIKGLKNIEFAEDGDITYEFSENELRTSLQYRLRSIENVLRRLRENMIEKDGLEKTDKIISTWEISVIGEPLPEPIIETRYSEPINQHEEKNMNEIDLLKKQNEELKDQLSKQKTESDKKLSEFSEKLTGLEAENKKLKSDVEKEFAEKVKTEETSFCEELVKEGKMFPHEKDAYATLLVDARMNKKTVNFAEKETSNYDILKGQLKDRKKVVNLSEHGNKGTGLPAAGGKLDLSPTAVTEAIRTEMGASEVK